MITQDRNFLTLLSHSDMSDFRTLSLLGTSSVKGGVSNDLPTRTRHDTKGA